MFYIAATYSVSQESWYLLPMANDKSFRPRDSLTVVVAASLIPSHPSTSMIEQTLTSLHLLGLTQEVPLVIAHDAPSPDCDSKDLLRYEDYFARLEEVCEIRGNSVITKLTKWGQLSQSLSLAFTYVKTPYVLVCQHDLPFIKRIEVDQILETMESQLMLKHVRFNLRENQPYAFDAFPKKRKLCYQEEVFELNGRAHHFVKTIGWSDNNHLCHVDYYRRIVFPLVGKRRVAPEHVMNLISIPSFHERLGTYIFGGLGDSPAIKHLDGKSGVTNVYRLPRPTNRTTVSGEFRFWWVRIQTQIWKIFYRVKFFYVIRTTYSE
jgi:hypothetical protein